MPTENTWYDRQALISKLLTYAAIVILLSSFAFGAYEVYRTEVSSGIYLAIAGTAIAALLAAFSAIIDLLIVHAEALHDLKNRK